MTLLGGDGGNTVNVLGTASTARNFTFQGGDGGETVKVLGDHVQTTTKLLGGSGADVFSLGGERGSLYYLDGSVQVDGGGWRG